MPRQYAPRNNSTTRHILLGNKGGEDLISSGLATDPTRLIYSQNVERLVTGGFARTAGYVLYDGQTVPITAVPGTGAVLGVVVFNGVVYAMRNDPSAKLFKATSSGWTLVYAFASPGVQAEFVVENFLGSAAGECLYGCDGGNAAWQLTAGGTLTSITSGATVDTPRRVEAHKSRLWLGFDTGEVRYSPVGEPAGTWANSWTAGVISIGRPVQGLKSLVGGVLAIFGSDRTYLLYGSISGTSGDFEMKEHNKNVGSVAGTIQQMTDCVFLDSAGVTTLAATQNFGDFALATRSLDIHPYISANYSNAVASLVLGDKQQYRLYFSEADSSRTAFAIGTVLSDTRVDWTRGEYPFPLFCTTSGEIGGVTRYFAGARDGYVYEIETGTSYNGLPYTSIWVPAFDHQGDSLVYKSYRQVTLEVDAQEAVTFGYRASFDYEAPGVPKEAALSASVSPEGARWGTHGEWGTFTWGGATQGGACGYLNGWAKSISVTFSHSSSTTKPFTLRAISYLFEPRRLQH